MRHEGKVKRRFPEAAAGCIVPIHRDGLRIADLNRRARLKRRRAISSLPLFASVPSFSCDGGWRMADFVVSALCADGSGRRPDAAPWPRCPVVSSPILYQNSMDSDAATTMTFPPIFSIYMTNHHKCLSRNILQPKSHVAD